MGYISIYGYMYLYFACLLYTHIQPRFNRSGRHVIVMVIVMLQSYFDDVIPLVRSNSAFFRNNWQRRSPDVRAGYGYGIYHQPNKERGDCID